MIQLDVNGQRADDIELFLAKSWQLWPWLWSNQALHQSVSISASFQ